MAVPRKVPVVDGIAQDLVDSAIGDRPPAPHALLGVGSDQCHLGFGWFPVAVPWPAWFVLSHPSEDRSRFDHTVCGMRKRMQ